MVRVINKSNEFKTFTLRAVAPDQTFTMEGNADGINVPPLGEEVRPVIISIAREDYAGRFQLEFTLVNPTGQDVLSREAEFLGPAAQLLNQAEP